MTQRVARPMKFAAFISIIVSAAVMFVACQGAVGPAGEQGPKGDKGEDGRPGTDGVSPFGPLAVTEKMPLVVISDTTNADNQIVAGVAQTIDLADYVHGTAERTYGTPVNSQETVAEQIFEATLVGSMLTITPKSPQPSNEYLVETFTVAVSDGGQSTAVDVVTSVRRNRAPASATLETPVTDRVGTAAPATAPDSVLVCPAANECYVLVTFTDDDDATANSTETLSFEATSADTSKVAVVSVDNNVDADGATQDLVARVVVRGVASTYNAGATTPADAPVEVVVVATDQGGLTGRGKASITVDGAPTVTAIPGGSVSASQPTYTIGTVVGYFTDPEAESLTYAVEVTGGDKNAVTATINAAGTDFVVTRNAPGTAEVTITATEDTNNEPDQSVKAVVTVTSS